LFNQHICDSCNDACDDACDDTCDDACNDACHDACDDACDDFSNDACEDACVTLVMKPVMTGVLILGNVLLGVLPKSALPGPPRLMSRIRVTDYNWLSLCLQYARHFADGKWFPPVINVLAGLC